MLLYVGLGLHQRKLSYCNTILTRVLSTDIPSSKTVFIYREIYQNSSFLPLCFPCTFSYVISAHCNHHCTHNIYTINTASTDTLAKISDTYIHVKPGSGIRRYTMLTTSSVRRIIRTSLSTTIASLGSVITIIIFRTSHAFSSLVYGHIAITTSICFAVERIT